MDSAVESAAHVKRLSSRYFYHLRQLRSIRRSLTLHIRAESCTVSGIQFRTIVGRRRPRSAANAKLVEQGSKTKTNGPRSFAVSGPSMWNSLPLPLSTSQPSLTIIQYQKTLKI